MKEFEPAVLVDPLYEPLDMSVDRELYDKVSELYLNLLSTFELRKAAWQMQSGLLFEAFPGCTHTRRAHAIGCWILGWHSLQDIKVAVPGRGGSIPLREWLERPKKDENFTKEYLLSLLLHDTGHGPFSHALESNPSLEIDHEEIGRSLICNVTAADGINYHVLIKYLLSIYKIKKIPDTAKDYETFYKKAKQETRVIHDILENTADVKSNVIGTILKGGSDKPRLHALNLLVDSQVDIDRIDHFLRDSYYSGVKFADYRVRGLFQNLVIVPRGTEEYEKIHNNNPEKHKKSKEPASYLMVREEGTEQVEYLLTAREFIFDRVLFHPKNLKLIGALNMGVRLLAKYEPCIKSILPFMTDQILLQMFREDKFAGTTIEGYEKILRGEIPTKDFKFNKEFQLTYDSDNLKKLDEVYGKIEDFNSRTPTEPKVVIFSNLKKEKDDRQWWKNVISEKSRLPLRISPLKEDLFSWLKKKEKDRTNKVIIWYAEGVGLETDVGLPVEFLEKEIHE